jgi:hypothetical protein
MMETIEEQSNRKTTQDTRRNEKSIGMDLS